MSPTEPTTPEFRLRPDDTRYSALREGEMARIDGEWWVCPPGGMLENLTGRQVSPGKCVVLYPAPSAGDPPLITVLDYFIDRRAGIRWYLVASQWLRAPDGLVFRFEF